MHERIDYDVDICSVERFTYPDIRVYYIRKVWLCPVRHWEALFLFIKAKTEQRQMCQNDQDLTVSTVTEIRRDLTVSNAETQTVSTVTEMRRDSIVEIQTSQMSRPNRLYRDWRYSLSLKSQMSTYYSILKSQLTTKFTYVEWLWLWLLRIYHTNWQCTGRRLQVARRS